MVHRSHAVRLSVAVLMTCCGVWLSAIARAADAPVVPPKEGKSETIKLFNGRNLDGWHGNEKLWSVKDGVIVAKNSDPI